MSSSIEFAYQFELAGSDVQNRHPVKIPPMQSHIIKMKLKLVFILSLICFNCLACENPEVVRKNCLIFYKIFIQKSLTKQI